MKFRIIFHLLILFLIIGIFSCTDIGDKKGKDNPLGGVGTILPAQYGTGEDGDIIIDSGTVLIVDLYENDVVAGVITKRGVNKGLNYGVGTYDPQNDFFINANNFLIKGGASLITTAWGDTIDNRKGIIWIACKKTFTNKGSINLNGLGASGGQRQGTIGPGYTGKGSGKGSGAGAADLADGGGAGHGTNGQAGGSPSSGAGGVQYGDNEISTYITKWSNLYGSGGGGGAGGSGAGCGGAGVAGAGAIRIYARTLITLTGTITCDGIDGEPYNILGGSFCGAGGGGSGGSIYIETYDGSRLGVNNLTCSGGAGGSGGGGTGSSGRVHVAGTYTGSTSDPPIK